MRLNNPLFSFLILTSFFWLGCSSDDDGSSIPQGNFGQVQIKFENQFKNVGPIVLNQTIQTSSNGQKHLFTKLKYIISNITLTNSTGHNFSYHFNDPNKGAFIIDQNNAILNLVSLSLDSIPAGNYTKIKFGLGISPQAYSMGLNNQNQFWEQAIHAGMTWTWEEGYIFTMLEGNYGTETPLNSFSSHSGNVGNAATNGTPNLYREIELNFPSQIEVSSQSLPAIHIIADLNQFLSGETAIALDESNQNQTGSSPHLVTVTNNLSKMFSVDHIHQN
jgi:hypothetical protein